MPRYFKVPVHTTVDYFWVPARPAQYKPARVAIPVEPSRIQTCYLHTDPAVKPDIPHPRHHHNVFFEDHVHDWNWRNGELTYGSRAMDGEVWIRCEFDVPRYQVLWHLDQSDEPKGFKTFAAAKGVVTRRGREHRIKTYARDMATGETFTYDFINTFTLVRVTP